MGGDIQVLGFDGDTITCCEGEFEELIEGECECPTYLVRDEEGDCACENGGSPEDFCMGDPWWSDDEEEPCPGECFLIDDWYHGPSWVCPSNCEDPDPPGGGSSGTCGDERDVIIAEYPQFSVNLSPSCNDFANSGGTAHFSWPELNGRGPASTPPYGNLHWESDQWGIVKGSLKTGLETTRAYYGKPIVLTGGYRCPHGNASAGGSPTSWHVHGRAADLRSEAQYWSMPECETLRTIIDNQTNTVELLQCDTYGQPGHLHAAW